MIGMQVLIRDVPVAIGALPKTLRKVPDPAREAFSRGGTTTRPPPAAPHVEPPTTGLVDMVDLGVGVAAVRARRSPVPRRLRRGRWRRIVAAPKESAYPVGRALDSIPDVLETLHDITRANVDEGDPTVISRLRMIDRRHALPVSWFVYSRAAPR